MKTAMPRSAARKNHFFMVGPRKERAQLRTRPRFHGFLVLTRLATGCAGSCAFAGRARSNPPALARRNGCKTTRLGGGLMLVSVAPRPAYGSFGGSLGGHEVD